MLNKIEKEYNERYFRIHQEIQEAFLSLYYLKELKEVGLFDKNITFRNEFAYYIVHNMQEKLCLQIYKLIIDKACKNHKSIQDFVDKVINKNNLFAINISFEKSEYIDGNLENKVTLYRHHYLNHIGENLDIDPILITDLEEVLMKVAKFFNTLYIKNLIPINNKFTDLYLSNLRQKCKLAVSDTIKESIN